MADPGPVAGPWGRVARRTEELGLGGPAGGRAGALRTALDSCRNCTIYQHFQVSYAGPKRPGHDGPVGSGGARRRRLRQALNARSKACSGSTSPGGRSASAGGGVGVARGSVRMRPGPVQTRTSSTSRAPTASFTRLRISSPMYPSSVAQAGESARIRSTPFRSDDGSA